MPFGTFQSLDDVAIPFQIKIQMAQKLNDTMRRGIFGCVTNGRFWEFGQLFDQEFTQELRSYALTDLSGLFAALNGLLVLAREQALAPAA